MDEEIKNQIVKLLNNANEHVPAIVQELIDQKSGLNWVQFYIGLVCAILVVILTYLIPKIVIKHLNKDDPCYDINHSGTIAVSLFVGFMLFTASIACCISSLSHAMYPLGNILK